MGFNRVNKETPCPICGKPDWCLVATDQGAAICARVESEKLAGRCGAGWLHFLRDDADKRLDWNCVAKVKPRRPVAEIAEIAERCRQEIKPASILWLSDDLGVEPSALRTLGVGWNSNRRASSFPMRQPNGCVVGIRYRASNGSKFSETGSREGMFFNPDLIAADYLVITEGASDTAAMLSLGFTSCIGRSSCHCNIDQLVSLCRRRRFGRVVIVPDADAIGWHGANLLADCLREESQVSPALLQLPDDVKDVRQCIQSTKNADWLADQIGNSINPTLKG